jgi:hypothetical protein
MGVIYFINEYFGANFKFKQDCVKVSISTP